MIAVLPSNYDGKLQVIEHNISLATGITLAVPANSSRIWLMFSTPTSSINLAWCLNPVGATHGQVIGTSMPQIFTWERDGLMPTLDFYLNNFSGGALPYIWWEQLYTEKIVR